MAADGKVVGTVVYAGELRPGDAFETLLTGFTGYRKRNNSNAASIGVPVEMWNQAGREVRRCLHPRVKVRLVMRAKEAA